MKKRIFSVILAALLTASALVSCSGDKPSEDTTVTPDTTKSVESTTTETETTIDPREIDELPTDIQYDGEDFKILCREYAATSIAWVVQDVFTEQENGERINDAVYARNLALNERFGVNVKVELNSTATSEASRRIAANEASFDVLQDDLNSLSTLVVNGYLLNMEELPYLNFEKAWWDTTAMSGLTVGDKVFMAFGASQLNGYKATWATVFNKELAADANLPDLYQIVKDGDWTLDKLVECATAISRDVDGDGEWTWGTDIYGAGMESGATQPLLMGTGVTLTRIHNDGTYDYLPDLATMTDAAEKIWALYNQPNNIIGDPQVVYGNSNDVWVQYRKEFSSDHFGFLLTHLGTPTLIAGDMRSDFGILPFPKVYEEQEEYISAIQYGNTHAMVIPKTAQDPERTALLLEGYEMFAYDTILPAYYEYTLNLRAARDSESSEMLDIIYANRNLDISLLYNRTTAMETTLISLMSGESFSFASELASRKSAMQSSLTSVIEAMMKTE